MSYRKTKLIQERNIILERKYILEQAPSPSPAPPTPAPAPSGGTTGTTTSQSAEKPTSDKISKEIINNLPTCSTFKNPPKENEREKIEQDGITMYKKTGSKTPYCKDEKK